MATATMAHLRDRVRGEIFAPEDPGYDDARKVYNAMIDRRPSAIVRCADVDDVAAAVNFAREGGRAIAVRGGSHSVPGFGTADDAVVIDLVRMQGVAVDPAAQDRPRPGRRDVGRVQRRDPRARPGHDGRHHLDDRRGRAHARRRDRLPVARARLTCARRRS